MSKERNEWTFLGRVIGSATGWDGEMESFTLYDFEPSPNIDLPSGDLQIEITTGLFSGCDDTGNQTWAKDIITTLGLTP